MTVETDFRAVYLPYCLQRQEDGSWLILNRQFKPVGFNTSEHIDYAAYPVSAQLSGIGPGTAKKLSCTEEFEPHRIFLYDEESAALDHKTAMDSYMERLLILARLPIYR